MTSWPGLLMSSKNGAPLSPCRRSFALPPSSQSFPPPPKTVSGPSPAITRSSPSPAKCSFPFRPPLEKSSPSADMMMSSPGPASMVSLPGPPFRTSSPCESVMRSSPAPPRTVSAPSEPSRMSSPSLPQNVSLSMPPQILSVPAVPLKVDWALRPGRSTALLTRYRMVPSGIFSSRADSLQAEPGSSATSLPVVPTMLAISNSQSATPKTSALRAEASVFLMMSSAKELPSSSVRRFSPEVRDR